MQRCQFQLPGFYEDETGRVWSKNPILQPSQFRIRPEAMQKTHPYLDIGFLISFLVFRDFSLTRTPLHV